MGFETLLYGRIEGAPYRAGGRYRQLQRFNRKVIRSLPLEDDWPFLTRHMFAFPGPFPHGGLYQSQVIHLGASFKEIDWDFENWLRKFEAVLRRLYWLSVRIHLEGAVLRGGRDFTFEWLPEQQSVDTMMSDKPEPVSLWMFRTNFPLDSEASRGMPLQSKKSRTDWRTPPLWDQELDG